MNQKSFRDSRQGNSIQKSVCRRWRWMHLCVTHNIFCLCYLHWL